MKERIFTYLFFKLFKKQKNFYQIHVIDNNFGLKKENFDKELEKTLSEHINKHQEDLNELCRNSEKESCSDFDDNSKEFVDQTTRMTIMIITKKK